MVRVLVDNDAKESTGKTQQANAGESVQGIDQVLAYTYNVKGEQTSMRRDNNVDGKYDYREVYTLDANGHQTAKEIDLTNDGKFDRKEVYIKEADDGLVQTNFYNLVDSGEVLTKIEYYKLNENNQRTEVKVDTLGDGSIDAITRYDLDEYGRSEKAYFDTDGDGNIDRVESYTRDSVGNILRTETDMGNDGSIDTVITYERDSLGYVSKSETFNSQGELQRTNVYSVDQYGFTTALSEYNGAISPDNLIQTREWTYNENGQAIKTYRILGNGTEQSWTRTFNEYGWSDYESSDINNDGTINSQLFIQEFDAVGKPIKLFRDNNVNGIFDQGDTIEIREYSLGLSKVVQNSFYSDEELTKLFNRYNYELNDAGDYTVATRDWNGDGKLNMLLFTAAAGYNPVNHTENITLWDEAKFAERATISEIALQSSSNIESTVVLDQDSLARFTANRLYIYGGAADDKVVLLNGKEDFTQAQDNVVRGSRTYDVYTASSGKELWIQDGITVDLDDSAVLP